MKTLHIRESTTTTHPLSDEQATSLAHLGVTLASDRKWWGASDSDEKARSVFRLTKLYDGNWRVEVGNVVGVVGLPGLTLIVEPKIGMAHFQHLLARSRGLPPTIDTSETSLGAAADLHRLVIEWFVRALERLLRRGLVRDYVDASDRIAFVRGHVRLTSTSRQWLQGRIVVDCEFEDFTEDTPANGFLAAAVLRAQRSSAIDDRLRSRLAHLARELPPPRFPAVAEIDTANLPRRYAHYRGALDYAADILAGVGRALDTGDKLSGTFLLNSAAVVEDGIRSVLSSGLHPIRVVKTGGRRLLPAFVSVNPDLEIGPPPFTGDVKYKIGDRGWNRQDLAQAVLFAAAYKSPRAIITDFVERDISSAALQVGEIQVSRLHWRVGHDVEPAESERQFVEVARQQLRGSLRGVPDAAT